MIETIAKSGVIAIRSNKSGCLVIEAKKFTNLAHSQPLAKERRMLGCILGED